MHLFQIAAVIEISDLRIQARNFQTEWLLSVSTQVMLGGYGFTFRYAPGGKHVANVEGSRSPHEGDLEFISLDLHKGCGKGLEKGFGTMEVHFSYKGSSGFSQPRTAGG